MLNSFVAKRALPDFRGSRVVILVGRYAERAGNHAVTASKADVFVVKHRTFLGFRESTYQTGGCASRFLAVHALLLDVDAGPVRLTVGILVDHCVVLRIRPAMLLENRLVLQGNGDRWKLV